jgi:hypothetical protein
MTCVRYDRCSTVMGKKGLKRSQAQAINIIRGYEKNTAVASIDIKEEILEENTDICRHEKLEH